ncbi:DAHL domain-containing protein [Nostoc sp.]|uniref:DAHL domain-containing protein n=1 Tax=Nostoc sp. TaxID=1180 RepID=UPI003593F861
MKYVQSQRVFIVLAAILVLVFLISKSLSLDFNQHQRYRSAIVELQEKDATFNQDILKFRYELFNSYDSLVNSLNAQKIIQQHLQELPSFIDARDQRQIQNILATQAELLKQKENLSERFKSQNATLKNSLRYLPELIAEINETVSDQKWFFPLKTALNNLLYDILLYNFTANEDIKPLIEAQIKKLSQIKDQYKVSEEQFSIKLTISHTRIILNNKPQVDELTNQILNIPIAQYAKTLETVYDDFYQKAIKTVNIYLQFAYGWFLVLLSGISYLIIKKFSEANHKITVLNERLKVENLSMSAELEITRRLQKMLLPKDHELSEIPGLEIAGFMESADAVGGDYYDVLTNNGATKIGIGDITGHGFESGVLMLMVQTAIRTLQESNETDPVRFMDILNRTIYKNIQRMNTDKNLTLSLLDYHQGKLSISGQHEEMVVVRASGEVERVETMELGFPIGLDWDIAQFIAQTHVQLHSGDVAVLYTDGITEAEDINGVQYGMERLYNVVKNYRQRSVTEIKEAVIRNLRQHIGQQKVFDDITLLVLKQK